MQAPHTAMAKTPTLSRFRAQEASTDATAAVKNRAISAQATQPTAVTEDSRSFPVSQSVAVYELQGDAYQLSSLERVRVGYTLTGYYDRSVADGGQIRVVIARSR